MIGVLLSWCPPLAFTADDCLDIGSDLGSPVWKDYFDTAPFAINGAIGTTKIAFPKK